MIETLLLSLLDRTALAGILVLSILTQIVAAIRLGPSGVWIARRYALWGIALYCGVSLVLSDLIILTDDSALADSFGYQRRMTLAPIMLSYLGGSLILLTVTGGIVSGLFRLVRKKASPPTRDGTG